MYGTIARMRVRAGAEEEFERLSREFEVGRAQGAGWIATAVYRSDEDPMELWMAVVFQDRASYEGNAGSPEQNEMYEKMRALLVEDPEWHDGEVIHRATV